MSARPGSLAGTFAEWGFVLQLSLFALYSLFVGRRHVDVSDESTCLVESC